MMEHSLFIFSVLILIVTFLPMTNVSYWWVRDLDFPRLQILIVSFLSLILSVLYFQTTVSFFTILILLVCVFIDLYRVAPYTFLFPKESAAFTNEESVGSFSLVTANVYINNSKSDALLEAISKVEPDLILLLEPDETFEKKCRVLEKTYKNHIKLPKDNTYGLLFYSKFKITNYKVEHLTDPEVPSIFAKLLINDDVVLHFVGLHPRPPRPNETDSDQRDGELMKASHYIEDHSSEPLVVAGDLNDVAWSHTTRLFKRTSKVLDPRVGRGMFNSFPTYFLPLRIPLDRVFHTSSLMLKSLKRLKDIGSDHFPIYVNFAILERKSEKQKAPSPDQSDHEERKTLNERGEKWEGPKSKPNKREE